MNPLDKVKEFLEEEIGSYPSIKWTIEEIEENQFEVSISSNNDSGENKTKSIFLRYNAEAENCDPIDSSVINVKLGESWMNTTTTDYRIKYFWMALLDWPF